MNISGNSKWFETASLVCKIDTSPLYLLPTAKCGQNIYEVAFDFKVFF